MKGHITRSDSVHGVALHEHNRRFPAPLFDRAARAELAAAAGPHCSRARADDLVAQFQRWLRTGRPEGASYEQFLAGLQLVIGTAVLKRAGAKLAGGRRRWLLSERDLVEEIARQLLLEAAEERAQ